jgi:uncharacterized protein (DUF924 family)
MVLSSTTCLALLTVTELASKSFVQRACSNPMLPESVLSFFYGVNYFDNKHQEIMREGTPLGTMMSLWYQQNDEYDKLCQSFVPAIRAAGKGDLVSGEWTGSIDGLMSQVILCDQLSRNSFRGTEEAFQYDSVAERLTLQLIEEYKKKPYDRSLPGEFYPPYINFLVLPLMHSEAVANHELGVEVLDTSLQELEGSSASKQLEGTKHFLLDHKKVLDRFGRYPYRNGKLGRETTPEEQAWLDDKDNLPGWAKSQG